VSGPIILRDLEQGSLDWIDARIGIPTASALPRIITPGGKLSAQRDQYMAELCAEYFEGVQYSEFRGTAATERGHEYEPQARAAYRFDREADVDTVGIIYRDDSRMFGASPDGLVGEDGGLELKCPSGPNHLAYLARGVVPSHYMPQVQGALWASGRSWWDWMSYHPAYPSLIVRVEPEEKYQDALDQHIPAFIAELLDMRARLESLGVTRARVREENTGSQQ